MEIKSKVIDIILTSDSYIVKKAATIPKTPPERDTKINAVHEQIPENKARPDPVKPKPLTLLLNIRNRFNEIAIPDNTETIITYKKSIYEEDGTYTVKNGEKKTI